MMKPLIGGAAAALVVAVAPALAQPAPPAPPGVSQGTASAPMPPKPNLHMMVWSDRVMTRDEVVKHVQELFARVDSNHDGFITKDEIEAFHRKIASAHEMGGERLAQHRMSMPDRGAMFDRLDTNHDGVISREEFMAGQQAAREEHVIFMVRDARAKSAAGQPEAHGMHMRGAAMGMGFAGRLFEMADANHDGKVSLKEAEDAALAHFDRMDLNHDGKVTPEERKQAHALMKEHKAN